MLLEQFNIAVGIMLEILRSLKHKHCIVTWTKLLQSESWNNGGSDLNKVGGHHNVSNEIEESIINIKNKDLLTT